MMSQRCRLGLLGLACITPFTAPRAQVLDQVFPQGVPGYGTAPGVTVLSRLHPEFDSRGIHYGGLTISPDISIGAGYDSDPNGVAAPSAIGLLQPSLRIEDPILGLGAYASGSFSQYPRDPSQNTRNLTAGIGLDIPLGPDTLTMGGAHLVIDETALGLDSIALTAPAKISVNDFRATSKINLGMLEITPGFGVTSEAFGAALLNNVLLSQTYQNRTVLHQSLQLVADPSGVLDYTMLFRVNEAHYAAPLADGAAADSTTVESLAGISTRASGLWHARILAGIAHRIFADRVTPSQTTPVIELGLDWMPDELTSLDLGITRSIDLSTASGLISSTLTTVDLAMAEEYFRNLILTGELIGQHAQGNGVNQTLYAAKAGMTLHLSREFSVSAHYQFEDTTGVLGRTVHDNLVTAAIEWTP